MLYHHRLFQKIKEEVFNKESNAKIEFSDQFGSRKVRKGISNNTLEWNPDGIAFGLSEKTYYIAETIPFSSGDVFLFITDGLSEAVNGQYEEFGIDRIKSSLRIAAVEQSPGKIYSRIMKDLDNFSGSQTIRDDISILVLKIV